MFGKESLRGAIYINPGDVEESEASTGTNVEARQRDIFMYPQRAVQVLQEATSS